MSAVAKVAFCFLATGLACVSSVGGGAKADGVVGDPVPRRSSVTLADLAWLQGTWRGEGPEGTEAEIHYMAPTAGGLPSIFRLWQGEDLVVIELLNLVEDADGMVMHIRHFTEDLTALEEDHPLTIRVVEGSPDRLYFENVRDENPRVSEMVRTGPDAFTSRSELHRADGSVDTIQVSYTRVGDPGSGPGSR